MLAIAGVLAVAAPARAAVVVVDAQAGGSGALLRVDPDGTTHTVASGGAFQDPADVVEEADGTLVVVDTKAAALIAVDPASSEQRILFRGAPLIAPRGIGRDAAGTLWVADRTPGGLGAVVRAQPTSGGLDVQTFATTPAPVVDVIVANGAVYALTRSATAVPIVVRLDTLGNQTTIGGGTQLGEPSSLAASGDTGLLVTDTTTDAAAVHRIDLATAASTIVAARDLLRRPAGIAVDPSGLVLVVDAERGALVGIDGTGDQRLLTPQGTFVSGRSVVVTKGSDDPGGPGGTCGNGAIELGEACDDGNRDDGDCCSSACTTAAWDGTSCDDGDASTDGDVCSAGRCAGSTVTLKLRDTPVPCRSKRDTIVCKDRTLVCRFRAARRASPVACEATGSIGGDLVVEPAARLRRARPATCHASCASRQATRTGMRRGKRVVLRLTLTPRGREILGVSAGGELPVPLTVQTVDEQGNHGRVVRQLLFQLRSRR